MFCDAGREHMRLGGDAPGHPWLTEETFQTRFREFVEKDISSVVEQCVGRCLSKHGQLQEARFQDMLREEHVPLNVSLARLSNQVAQLMPSGTLEAKLNELAATVDRLVGISEGRRDALTNDPLEQVRHAVGDLLDERIEPLKLQLEHVRRDMSMRPAALDGLVGVTPQPTARSVVHNQDTQTDEMEDGGQPMHRSSTLRRRGTVSQMQYVLASIANDGGHMEHVEQEGSWWDVRRRSRSYYHDAAQHIRDQRLKAQASWLKIIVQSYAFEVFFSVVIVCHLIYMVADNDRTFGMQGGGRGGIVFELGFLVFYIAELGLKIAVDGWRVFTGIGAKANIFDLFLILNGLVDAIAVMLADGELLNSMALKALRVLRLQKVFRIHKVVGIVSDTRMVLEALGTCASVLIGASALVFLYFLSLAIFFSQSVSSYVAESRDEMKEEAFIYYDESFSTVFRTIFTLYQCVSGGQTWINVWAALVPIWPGGMLAIIFVLFHFIYLVLMVNVVSSVYVQKLLLYSVDQTQGIKLRMERTDRHDAKKLLEDCDHNFGAGETLNYQELLRLLFLPEVRALFEIRGIKLEDVRALHRTIAEKPPGLETCQEWQLHVNRQEFFRQCMRLTRDISTTDFAKSLAMFRNFEIVQYEHKQNIDETLKKLEQQMERVTHIIRQAFS